MSTAKMLSPLALVGALACQGQTFPEPPIHLQQNMDFQTKFEAQEYNEMYEDGRAMRMPVPGTVAVGGLRVDDHLYVGKINGEHVATLPKEDEDGEPLELSQELIERGQDRYGIYCLPCHGAAGAGNGMVVQRGMLQPPALSDARLLSMNVGYFYDVITNGVRNMPPYASQIPVRDRWAIAAYVRVLQRSQHATIDDVPSETASEKGWK